MAWTFLNNLIDVTSYITADSTWRTTATITELPSDTTVIWLRVRQTDTTSRTVGASHPNITYTGQGYCHSLKPQYWLIGVSSRAFRYYCSDKTNQYWEILAYSNNPNEAYTTPGNYPTKTPSLSGSYDYKSFSELPSGAAFAALLIDQGGTMNKIACRHDGATYDEYYYKSNSVMATVFCPLENNIGEIKVENTGNSPIVLTGGLVSGAVKFSTPQAITIPTTGWTTIDASAIFPAGANLAILECRNLNATTARTCAVRNTGSSDNITSGVAIYYNSGGATSLFKLVGLNSNRQFDINVSNTTDVQVKAYGYISNALTLYLNDYFKLNLGLMAFNILTTIKRKKNTLEFEFN